VSSRIGAYILPGDPIWLRKSLAAYYGVLSDLVVAVPENNEGWNGHQLPVEQVRRIVSEVDSRGIAREIRGRWTNRAEPMRADTAQRQAALDALAGTCDWVLQIDNDEFVPNLSSLLGAISYAETVEAMGIEWPMRVLYRRTSRSVLEVVGPEGQGRYDYPGSVVARPDAVLTDARRVEGDIVRATVRGDTTSLQVTRPPRTGEMRWDALSHNDAIIHNSWARSPSEVWRKTRSWGHADGLKGVMYYATRWYPSPLTWRIARDIHPFARGLWPRLARRPLSEEYVD
jgi:hypothetical protein